MKTIAECRRRLYELFMQTSAAVVQIDACLAEDETTCVFLAHLNDGGGIVVNLDLSSVAAASFDPSAYIDALAALDYGVALH